MSNTLRKAGKKDMPGILRLVRAHPEQLMQIHLPRPSEFFVAIEDGAIIGCCALEVYSKRLAEIRSLAVAPEARGRGLASELIKLCLAEAQKRKIYEVLTITGATELFEKQGFGTFHKEKYALLKVLSS